MELREGRDGLRKKFRAAMALFLYAIIYHSPCMIDMLS